MMRSKESQDAIDATLSVLRAIECRGLAPGIPSTRWGVVYFIQHEDIGPMKIGFTSEEPEARLSSLQCANPHELILRAYIPGGYMLESAMHAYCQSERFRGEWFHPKGRVLELLEYAKNDDICKVLDVVGPLVETARPDITQRWETKRRLYRRA